MAQYHHTFSVVQRSQGESAVAAAAWQHAVNLKCEYDGRTIRCASRSNVVSDGFMLPPGSPIWSQERYCGDTKTVLERYWNDVEAREVQNRRAAAAQLARKIGAALPFELSIDQNLEVSRTYLARYATGLSMPLSWAIVETKSGPYLQALVSMRRLTETGFGLKEREQNGRKFIKEMRAAWAEDVNDGLRRAGLETRIDHRSNKDRGLPPPQKPTLTRSQKGRQKSFERDEKRSDPTSMGG